MNGIEKITARILADAQAEADAVKAEAQAKCAEIKGDYDKKAQDEYWKLARTGVAECEAKIQRLGRAAEMEAKKNVLTLKQDMVSQAFEKATAQVCSMPEDEYVAFLARLAAKASGTGDEEILVAEKDAAIGAKIAEEANKLCSGQLHFDGNTLDMPGGIVLRQGNIEINCNIETLVNQYRYELASQVAEVLFG